MNKHTPIKIHYNTKKDKKKDTPPKNDIFLTTNSPSYNSKLPNHSEGRQSLSLPKNEIEYRQIRYLSEQPFAQPQ